MQNNFKKCYISLRNLCLFINTTCNLRILNKSNPLFPNFLLRLQSVFEEKRDETLKVENNISLVQDQVFVCGDVAAVIGAMAKYNTTRKEVARKKPEEMCTLGKSDAWL